MERTRSASDKIRPFLEAMERRIDKVRRDRLEESGESDVHATGRSGGHPNGRPPGTAYTNGPTTPTHQSAAPNPSPSAPAASNDEAVIGRPHGTSANPASNPSNNEDGEDAENKPPQRLKARPKRPSAFTNRPFDQDNYRSQAG